MKARNPKMPSFRGDVIDGKLKEDKHINFKKQTEVPQHANLK